MARGLVCVQRQMQLLAKLVLAFLACPARGHVLTHFTTAMEFGVEQLALGSTVTFFAAVRQPAVDAEYVLSVGPPQCEANCAQSTNSVCRADERVLNAGWEHIELAHYPTPTDNAAIYIRRTVDLLDTATCFDAHTGELYLSVVQHCDAECPVFETVNVFAFDLAYAGNVSGLSYALSKHSYSARATRNIRVPRLGVLIEIETVLESETLVQFERPRVVLQECTPAVTLVAMSGCDETEGTRCTQRLYLQPANNAPTALGRVVLEMQLEGGLAAMHVELDVDAADTGTDERALDFVLSRARYNGSLAPYVYRDLLNSTLVDGDTVCVSMMRLAGETALELVGVVSENTSFPLMRLLGQGPGAELACFQLRKLVAGSQVVQLLVRGEDGQLGRRDLYSEGHSASVYCDCPWGYYWDDGCECCAHSHHHDHDDWWWVLGIVGFLLVVGCLVAAVAWCPGERGSSVYLRHGPYPHSYYVHGQGAETLVYVRGDKNTVQTGNARAGKKGKFN